MNNVKLTHEQIKFMRLLARGLSGSEIQKELRITIYSVRNRVNNLCSKFYLRTESELRDKARAEFGAEQVATPVH